ncbi:hypothetical protein AB0N05_13835 [Nocardia sp. NPDC051030]|uniref:hypothetical protein n=1 Tax=Nocardia sp. NPDC051030 TaxID=3155162 RepID=UPI0034136862
MTSEPYRRSRENAAAAVAAVLAVLNSEEQDRRVFHWHSWFASIADVIGDTGLDDKAAVEQAKEINDRLYSASRNVTDFYFVRADIEEQRIERARLRLYADELAISSDEGVIRAEQ